MNLDSVVEVESSEITVETQNVKGLDKAEILFNLADVEEVSAPKQVAVEFQPLSLSDQTIASFERACSFIQRGLRFRFSREKARSCVSEAIERSIEQARSLGILQLGYSTRHMTQCENDFSEILRTELDLQSNTKTSNFLLDVTFELANWAKINESSDLRMQDNWIVLRNSQE